MSTAYSKTPLYKKLGIKEGYTLMLYNAPKHYWTLFDYLPDSLEELEVKEDESADFIHAFFKTKEELVSILPDYISALKKNGMIWISWPKGTSKMDTDLSRDWIRDYILKTDLVDVKVASIDETWSGLKFVYRVERR